MITFGHSNLVVILFVFKLGRKLSATTSCGQSHPQSGLEPAKGEERLESSDKIWFMNYQNIPEPSIVRFKVFSEMASTKLITALACKPRRVFLPEHHAQSPLMHPTLPDCVPLFVRRTCDPHLIISDTKKNQKGIHKRYPLASKPQRRHAASSFKVVRSSLWICESTRLTLVYIDTSKPT